ncbi:MAG: hypothetical protein B6I18_09645 [Bacteroidetes bacterium 4572_112]|nr:MAG: hypothetical protein B6I18_09645 [Bacteroidetes bacterium 4572_112]
MKFSELGHIALNCWYEIPSHYPNAILDEFILMPNHIHGIINLQNDEYNTYGNLSNVDGHTNTKDVACNASTNRELSQKMSGISPKQKSLSAIIRSYKSAVSRIAGRAGHDFVWQSNYYDRIIRNAIELQSIRHYIRYNPLK